jgi:hypothetical protein
VCESSGECIFWVPAQAWLPDSPRWLLWNGDGGGKAEAALVRARGKYGGDVEVVRAEIAAITQSVREAQQEPEVGEELSEAVEIFIKM